ncbi:MAG: serine/threonine protein phosphatase [Flavobacteriales bacterium]|nr:serine/threonine protein phosphatase [Flavobacteriales bacterium]
MIKQIFKNSEFKFHYEIPENKAGRILVIADIHGCSKTFNQLIKQIELTKEDQLFILGDMINKGPNSLAVLDKIFDLIQEDYLIYPLKGNHEGFVLDDLKQSGQIFFRPGRKELKDGDGKYSFETYSNFFRQLPYYYKIANTIMVHAGLNFDAKNPLTDYESMLWIRDFEPDDLPNYRILHGHNSSILKWIKEDVANNSMIINLDNGCCKTHKLFMGKLLCLDLTNMLLYEQINIEE